MFAAVGTAAALCLVEGGEALAALSGRRPRPWRETAGAAGGALLCLGVLGVLVAVVAVLPGRAVRPVAAAVVLLIGLQWLVRAVLRLLRHPVRLRLRPLLRLRLRPRIRHLPDAERSAFAIVLAAGVEAVLACVALATAADARAGLWAVFGWALCGWGFVVLAAGVGLVVPRVLAAPPERIPKAVLGLSLTATGAAAVAPVGWWVSAAVAGVVAVAVLRLRSAPPPGRAQVGTGVRGFLLGDTALTWPAAAVFAALAATVAAPWRPPLLAAVVTAVLVTATERPRQERGSPQESP
ncbi:hypothetical protein OK074_4918 [Actinobacteria bacterium OK074]|nr:hypothetical protein OK074_4918 [Actinobacteria bacterium OK074]